MDRSLASSAPGARQVVVLSIPRDSVVPITDRCG
jgi:anionic cell wall polymer biosynthesis LytR-Cps2A-Psr (LCP) family protein